MVGPDHVAIGTDFCMEQPRSFFEWLFMSQGTIPATDVPYTPEPYQHLRGFADPSDWVKVAEGLLNRNYSESDMKKVLGENWLSLFGQVWSK